MGWLRAKLAAVAMALVVATSGVAGAQGQAALEKVSVASLRITANSPLFIAAERGYFRDEGLEPSFNYFESAQQSVVAVVSGDVQFGVGGLSAGFYNLGAKGGLKIVAAQTREEPGFQNNGFVVTNAAFDKGLKTLADLPGHSVGINSAGSTQHYALGLVGRKYGFDLSKVTVVALQAYPNLVAAFKGGQIDSMVATVSIAHDMESLHLGHIIGWSGDETPWQLGAIYVRPRMIADHRATVERFLRAWIRGAHDYHAAFNQLDAAGHPLKGPGYDALVALLSKALQQTPDQVRDALPYIDADARVEVVDIGRQIAFWKDQKLLDPRADPAQMLDLSFIAGTLDRK